MSKTAAKQRVSAKRVLRMGAGELSKKNIRNEPDRSDLSFSFRLISCILIYNQNVISLRRKAKL